MVGHSEIYIWNHVKKKAKLAQIVVKWPVKETMNTNINPFASGIKKVLLYPITGLFSVKIRKKILVIKNFSVNDTMSGQPNKCLIHWHFEN